MTDKERDAIVNAALGQERAAQYAELQRQAEEARKQRKNRK
jgi:hypothetical protein